VRALTKLHPQTHANPTKVTWHAFGAVFFTTCWALDCIMMLVPEVARSKAQKPVLSPMHVELLQYMHRKCLTKA